MSESTRTFPLGVVLSVTTGRLLCDIGDVYDVLGYMTGESLFTHQLPRASRECEAPILAQHPDLAGIEVPGTIDSMETCQAWLDSIAPQYGTERTLRPLAAEDHTPIDPITELRMMKPDAEILVVEVPDDVAGRGDS